MPEVFRYSGYRFFFFSNEGEEPIHVHVENANKCAKFWIEPYIGLVESYGFQSREIKAIRDNRTK